MTADELENIKYTIEEEGGLDYTFNEYSSFSNIQDDKFHELREAYIKAHKDISDYLGL